MDHEMRAMYAAMTFYKRRWTLEILAALAQRPQRFNELQRAVEASSATAFNEALVRLERHGLVHRPTPPDQRHYTLTSKGKRVLPALTAFIDDIQWWEAPDGDDPAAP